MTAEIVDFVDKKLEKNAQLKVFNVVSEEMLFECDLGKKLFRKEGPRTLAVNRNVSVQYEYSRRRPCRLEAYIYLGHEPVIGFPKCDAVKDQLVRFDLNKDTILVENKSETPAPMKPNLSRLSIWEWIMGGIIALGILAWVIFITYKATG